MTTPSSTIRPIAVCHEPAAFATWKATTAFSPIPLASASGKLAMQPISRHEIPAAAAVHAIAESLGTPAAARMDGLTKRMYAIVKNVATAPRASRAGVLPRSEI
jgi:hypothetical protein